MDDPMPTRKALASHLRNLRLERGMTLNELEGRCGVSRATLSRIETGEVSPSAEALGRIAASYQVSISTLFQPIEPSFEPHVPAAAQAVWNDAASGLTRRMISPASGLLRGEVIEATIAAGRDLHYDTAPVPGQEHHLVLLEGALALTVGEVTHDLRPGDCLRYRLSGASHFQSGAEGCRYLLFLI